VCIDLLPYPLASCEKAMSPRTSNLALLISATAM
jgi:hypothetical protein